MSVYQHGLACSPARTSQALMKRLDEWLARSNWLALAPAMVRACSTSRRQSRSRRSDCSATVSGASNAGLLTGLACRAEHAQGAQGALSGIYMHARRRRLDRVSSPRPPSARQAPKLNKGSPLPRQRTPTLPSRHDDLTCSVYLDDDDDDNDSSIQRRQHQHHRQPPPHPPGSPSLPDLTPP